MNLDSLRYKIDNKAPVELQDLAESMLALGAEYQKFSLRNADPVSDANAKLYVREIKTGSVLVELVPWAAAALPLVENFNTVIQFGQFVSGVCKALLGEDGGEADNVLSEVDNSTLENVCSIVEPVAKDGGSVLNIGTVQNLVINNNVTINSRDANAIQNAARRKIKAAPVSVSGRHERVVMTWHRTTADTAKCAGDRSIIESINKKAVKTESPAEIKHQLMDGEKKPFHYAYIVDVDVETVRGEPVLYKITAFHDSIQL